MIWRTIVAFMLICTSTLTDALLAQAAESAQSEVAIGQQIVELLRFVVPPDKWPAVGLAVAVVSTIAGAVTAFLAKRRQKK